MGKDKKLKPRSKYVAPPCHEGFKRVYQGLYLGKKSDVGKELLKVVDVLIPLDSIVPDLWDDGWTLDKEIFYLPVEDFGTLPDPIEDQAVDKIVGMLKAGKKVAIFCLGGHGRTGYMGALVLGRLGITDPIGHLRDVYCRNAVESNDQVKAIARITNNPGLITKYRCSAYGGYGASIKDWYTNNEYIGFRYSYGTATTNPITTDVVPTKRCGDCAYFNDLDLSVKEYGYCECYAKTILSTDVACGSVE